MGFRPDDWQLLSHHLPLPVYPGYRRLFRRHRGAHSFETLPHPETTQLLLDLYHHEDAIYVHPLKVYPALGSTMYLPHKDDRDQCIPLTNSAEAARFFLHRPIFSPANRHVDYWDRLFEDAARIRQSGNPQENDEMLAKLRRLLLTDDGRIARLAHEYFDLSDLVQIKNREVGTGKIGGKAIGMLLSRKILALKGAGEGVDPDLLEPHDSYYLGADLFYTYIVQNGWWTYVQNRRRTRVFQQADELRKHLLEVNFRQRARAVPTMLESFAHHRSSSVRARARRRFWQCIRRQIESIFVPTRGSVSKAGRF